MKNLFLVFLQTISILILYSCSKNNSENYSLVGNWNVVNDSSLNTNKFYSVSTGDTSVVSGNYNGVECGATFNFTSKGKIISSFDNCSFAYPLRDSAKYVLTNNQLTTTIYAQSSGCCSFIYLNPVITRTYKISNLTANTATLTYSQSGSSALPVIEIINLKK
ncbi:MAG: hypothetical protein ABI091_13005 [Ferruginibacter sp.]